LILNSVTSEEQGFGFEDFGIIFYAIIRRKNQLLFGFETSATFSQRSHYIIIVMRHNSHYEIFTSDGSKYCSKDRPKEVGW
jgi:hypothetical protein